MAWHALVAGANTRGGEPDYRNRLAAVDPTGHSPRQSFLDHRRNLTTLRSPL